ncbi:MAG TPA: lysylphosphatidylglycerol synthase transmembrane domain-containing protein [Terriglobia bacterium]
MIATVLVYRWSDFSFDWSLFFTSLWNVQPLWLTVSIAATFLTFFIRAIRWQVLLHPLKSIPLGPLTSMNLVGFSAICVLGRAGELIRPLWLTRKERIPLTVSMATLVVERFFDSVMLVVLFACTLLLVKVPTAAIGTLTLMKNAAWIIILGSVVSLGVLFLFRSNIDRIVDFVPFKRLSSLLRSFSDGLSFLEKSRTFGLVIAHSAVLWIAIAFQFWFMLLGMKLSFSVAAATLVMVVTAIGSVAQVPGIGGGFQAGYIFCMTTFFALPKEQAVATSLIAWASSSVPVVVAGALYMVSHGLSLKDLKAQAVPAE